MGWISDYPDFKDYTENTEEIKSILGPPNRLKVKSLPVSSDLRQWCPPVENQGRTVRALPRLGSASLGKIYRRLKVFPLQGHTSLQSGMKMKNTYGEIETTGALLLRNSWGGEWGEEGYGWLPYDYILSGLSEEFWSILKKEWIDSGQLMG